MIPVLYRGSVKNLLGPVALSSKESTSAVVFEYTDAFSVFDWGRMPDLLFRKGEALAILAAHIMESLEKPETWKEFSRSPEALALRKGNRFGAVFNELGEELQAHGLRTHYLGVMEEGSSVPVPLAAVQKPVRRVAVRQVSVVKPSMETVLGRTLPDYYLTRGAGAPRLVPLEVVFRLGCPEGSSLRDRVARDPGYLASLGFPDTKMDVSSESETCWDFPILELFTKLEAADRPVPLSEALAISGLSAKTLQDILLKTAWIAGLLRYWCSKLGLTLSDGKLEWAMGEDGRAFLVDAIGPDELRLSKKGQQLSKEFLRKYYRNTPWYEWVEKAKKQAKHQGVADWKRFVPEGPPTLPLPYRELAIHVYLALTNSFTGKQWFPEAWSLDRVADLLGEQRVYPYSPQSRESLLKDDLKESV